MTENEAPKREQMEHVWAGRRRAAAQRRHAKWIQELEEWGYSVTAPDAAGRK